MKINSKAYGPIEVNKECIFNFSQGIPPFYNLKKWALFEAKQKPFYILQSLDDEQIAFFLLSPLLFEENYKVEAALSDLTRLKINDINQSLCLAIVNIPTGKAHELTANLQAPVIFNEETQLANQCISTNPNWQIRHNLLARAAS
ncbi:MAG: flagellar assembly protein FliW [Spirochaetaceae bacterium]|nr:flagellar assembly protein FliW [Spirochaetaceae bacterium]